jgi:hypothetical protein
MRSSQNGTQPVLHSSKATRRRKHSIYSCCHAQAHSLYRSAFWDHVEDETPDQSEVHAYEM